MVAAARGMSTRDRPTELGSMPTGWGMTTVDERLVRAPLERIFMVAVDVERWPEQLRHYRRVRLIERDPAGGGLVEMSANRPFGLLNWPTWWVSEMETRPLGRARPPAIRFRHVRGITTGMEVEWSFVPASGGTQVRIVHEWNGPGWPVIGGLAAALVIGPIFIHGIASRTLAGLAHAAER
jgi:ribosome-associated toxin RatA of RatAB toxin-antitoxin module